MIIFETDMNRINRTVGGLPRSLKQVDREKEVRMQFLWAKN